MKNAACLTALVATLALATGAGAQPGRKPKLIVAISVDQFSADLFAEYRPHWSGGLGRLSEEGVIFPSGYQGHAATETCPGHSTILTGSHPARTGIIANDWFDLKAKRADKKIYCAEDETVAGSSSENYTVSAVHLNVPTLGERIKAADPAARSFAVAGKDRAAAMMGGKVVDQIWWWNAKAKAFVGPAAQTPSPVVAGVNANIASQLAAPREALSLPPLCAARERAVPIGGGETVGTHRFARQANDAGAFRASPELDRATLALAAALAGEMKLGQGTATDVLAVGLSATDYVGHGYGTEGVEMCLQLLALDHALCSFFDQLDATGIDYLVVLTADHGGHDLPERNRERAATTAVRADPELEAEAMGKKIAQEMHLPEPLLYGRSSGDLYVDLSLSARQRARVLARARELYRAHPQVAAVFTRAELAAQAPPTDPPESWSLAERARASFGPRSGDLIVLLKPRVTPIAAPAKGYVATHGSPWDYDRRVPILFWRKGMVPFEQPLAVETADILPTLAAQIGLHIPAGEIDGRCLDLDSGAGSTCP